MNKEQLEKYVRSFGLDEARARQELESRLQLLATLGLSEDKRFQLLVQGARESEPHLFAAGPGLRGG